MSEGASLLPKFDYYLDESDPDVVVIRRQDGSFVAAFSARGATTGGILQATQDDYAALLREHAGSRTRRSEAGAPEHRAQHEQLEQAP